MIHRLVPAVLTAALAGLVVVGAAGPAAAGGGDWLDPVLDRYSPGEVATVVAYTAPGQQGWVGDGPYQAYLRAVPFDRQENVEEDLLPAGEHPSDISLGPLVLQETGRGGMQALRISLTFNVPDLEPGAYAIHYCNADCSYLGQLVGGTIWVDVDPSYSISRSWPEDDPARAGAAADVPLPPPPPTTQPPTTAPSTTTTSTTTSTPSTSRAEATSSTEIATETIVSPTGPSEPTTERSRPGWVLLALGVGTMAIVVGAALRARRPDADGTPRD